MPSESLTPKEKQFIQNIDQRIRYLGISITALSVLLIAYIIFLLVGLYVGFEYLLTWGFTWLLILTYVVVTLHGNRSLLKLLKKMSE